MSNQFTNDWTQELEQLKADNSNLLKYKALLSSAHGALADTGLPVPAMDKDIAPVIRQLITDRDRYKRLAEELATFIESIEIDVCGEIQADFDRRDELLDKARQEGVIE